MASKRKGSAVAVEADDLRAGLVKAIAAGLVARKLRSPAYAVAISLRFSAERVLPPCVSCATEADAQHFRRSRVRDLTAKAWNPDGWLGLGVDALVKVRLPPPLGKLCAAASDELEPVLAPRLARAMQTPRHGVSVRDTPLGPLLEGIVADLRAADLRIPRSKGFVVYAVDELGMLAGDVARKVAHEVGPEQRTVLERRGLLAPRDGAVPAHEPLEALQRAPREAEARIAALDALEESVREDLEVAGMSEADIEEGRRILRWCDAEPGVSLESLDPGLAAIQARFAANPLMPAPPTGPRPDDLPDDPAAARLAKLRFLRVWLDGWDDTLRLVVSDADARARLGVP